MAQSLLGGGNAESAAADPVSSISLHPVRLLLAVSQCNVVSVHLISLAGLSMELGAAMSLSRHRFGDASVCCVEWTHESQNSFIVGTSSGVFYCVLPTIASKKALESTNVEIRALALPAKHGIDLIATCPQGRLFACASSRCAGDIYVCDAWMGTVSALRTVSAAFLQLSWLRGASCVFAPTR